MFAALHTFFDLVFWQQLVATMVGVGLGVPIALWLNRLEERRETTAARGAREERREQLLAALKREREFNREQLQSLDRAHRAEKIEAAPLSLPSHTGVPGGLHPSSAPASTVPSLDRERRAMKVARVRSRRARSTPCSMRSHSGTMRAFRVPAADPRTPGPSGRHLGPVGGRAELCLHRRDLWSDGRRSAGSAWLTPRVTGRPAGAASPSPRRAGAAGGRRDACGCGGCRSRGSRRS